MSRAEVYEAAGFSFPTKVQADAALEEEKKIYYIRSRIVKSSSAEVLLIYNKMIKGNVLTTPVGMVFLKELHDRLIKDPDINAQEIDSIPFGASYDKDAADLKTVPEAVRQELEKCKGRLKFCGMVIAALVVCVIAMFAITMKSDDPNILNYETALQNKYAQWDQELKERERKIRAKEEEEIRDGDFSDASRSADSFAP